MKRTEFRVLPVPAEVFNELGFTEDMTLEAFVEGRRLVLQKMDEEDTFCEGYDEDCEGCPYCCPCCGECLKDQIEELAGEDEEDE